MDAKRFDLVTRSFAGILSRRSILGLASRGIAGSLLGLADAEAKKRKKGKRNNKGKGKNKGKKCKHPPCGPPCTVSRNAVSLVTETKFNKKPLRLRQRADFADGDRQTEVTLGDNSVLRIAHEVAEPGVITTVTYGGAFRGIDQARFTTDGATITGEIDGRALVPLPVDADPSQVTFADGGPPLEVQGDSKLVQAIQGLFAKAAQQAGACQPAQQKRSASTKDSSSFDCIAKQAKCGADAVECERAVVDAAAACSIVPFLGTVVCAVVGTGYCAHEAATCVREAKYSPTCCPVRCGGDVGDLFGPDPLCCEGGGSCLDPNSNQSGGCCAAGTVGCGGECCPTGSCTSGFCCKTGVGAICGDQCCGPFASCCGGTTCCTGTCIGGSCCQSPNYDCGGFCCQSGNACCSGHCCAPGQICENNQCKTPTTCDIPCNGQCCQPGQFCCGGERCATLQSCPR
jgi:hypothetical protein